MKIVIVGPGAIGSLFASYLSKSKQEIWLLDKNKERAERLRQGINWLIPVQENFKQPNPIIIQPMRVALSQNPVPIKRCLF